MKRTKLAVLLCIVALLSCCGAAESWALAQGTLSVNSKGEITVRQPKPDPPLRLNAEASKTFAAIDAAVERLNQQYQQLEGQRAALLIGAGAQGMKCAKGDDGIVSCVKPEPSPSPAK